MRWYQSVILILIALMGGMFGLQLHYSEPQYDFTSVERMRWFQDGYIRSNQDICNGMVKGYPNIKRERIWTSDTYIIRLPFLGYYVEGLGFVNVTGWGCIDQGPG